MVEMYLQGVSTRKVRHIVEELCGTNVSRSTVSNLAKSIEENVTRWRNRKLNGNYPYLVIDARYEDVREQGVVVSKAVLIVIGINESGKREILAVELDISEDE
jgi:putative transposase